MFVFKNKSTGEKCTEKVLFSKVNTELSKLASLGWYLIKQNYISHNEITENMIPDGEEYFDENKQCFIQDYKIIPVSVEEQNVRIEQKKFRAFEALRSERDKRLSATDYLLNSDYPISEDNLEQIKAYRKALRDLPSQEGSPWIDGEIPWPDKPDFLGE